MNRKLTKEQASIARAILGDCTIPLNAQWQNTTPKERERLAAWATYCLYRKPLTAERGSRTEHFYRLLQRRAQATLKETT